MQKSGTLGTARMPEQGIILTFSMDWGPNFGWNTFLKFENPSMGSKFRQIKRFLPKIPILAKKLSFLDQNLYFLAKMLCFWTKNFGNV
jgi:hypothetical protein